MVDLFVFAGETSGDLHGEGLLKALYEKKADLKIYGVGGPRMRSTGMQCVLPMEAFQVMGFVDVFLALPGLIRKFYMVANAILNAHPKAVLFIDYPGFNLRMAAHLRKKGYKGKLVHYISPSVWAWGKNRIEKMAKALDLLLVILPFEPACFAHTSLKVEYVGHPLTSKIPHFGKPEKNQVALFPGSRTKEIVRNLPIFLRVVKKLQKTHPDLQFSLSISDDKFAPLIQKILTEEKAHEITLVKGKDRYALMEKATIAIAKSGTVTLELALHGVPTVVPYAISFLDLIIARYILRILLPFYCIVNIIAGKEVFKELIGPNLTEDSLLHATCKLLDDREAWEKCREKCAAVRAQLQHKDPSHEAASHILALAFSDSDSDTDSVTKRKED